MNKHLSVFLPMLLIVAMIAVVVGCVPPSQSPPVSPTPPIPPTPKPSASEQLKADYPELFQELAKLPDLKETDDKDKEAIENIASLALEQKYRSAFESMLNDGIKDKRKYCSPLEALLWLAYDREFKGQDNPLESFDITYTNRPSPLVSGTGPRPKTPLFINQVIVPAWDKSSTSSNYTSARWGNFDEVVHRLSSPFQVALYMSRLFTYDILIGFATDGVPLSASSTFDVKKGVCRHVANFATYCLRWNGYEAHNLVAGQLRPVRKTTQGREYWGGTHNVSLYRAGSEFYFINGPFPGTGGAWIEGPFSKVEDAARKLSTDLGYTFEWYTLFDTDVLLPKAPR